MLGSSLLACGTAHNCEHQLTGGEDNSDSNNADLSTGLLQPMQSQGDRHNHLVTAQNTR